MYIMLDMLPCTDVNIILYIIQIGRMRYHYDYKHVCKNYAAIGKVSRIRISFLPLGEYVLGCAP